MTTPAVPPPRTASGITLAMAGSVAFSGKAIIVKIAYRYGVDAVMAVERVGATTAAQAGMIGPLSTIVMGVLILDEPFSAWIAAGTALVIGSVWLLRGSSRPTGRAST